MSEHTPLPWTYERRETSTCRAKDWIDGADGSTVVFDVGHLDGPFIVRAVNSHEKLIAACKAALADLENEDGTKHGAAIYVTDSGIRDAYNTLREAIQEAEQCHSK